MKQSLTFLISFLCIFAAFGQDIIKKGATPKKLKSEFSFTEGPAVDKMGNVFFTDQPNNRIWKMDVAGNFSVFMENSGRSNGMFFDNEGNLITCADENTELWKISPTGEKEVLLSGFEGKKFNGPNDVWVAANGDMYFTDPFYKRPWWDYKEMPQPIKAVYRFIPSTKELSIVATGFEQPNGIIGDNKHIYIADIGGKKTYKYEIDVDGSLKNPSLFCEMGSDGMTLDHKGNLYLTGKGVTVFNKAGEQIQQIDIPEPWTANVTFGGAKQKTLFMTSGKSVYTLEMKVKGIR